MIKVSFYEINGSVVRVRTVGHSGYAESGSDIICAAVSTLVQTAFLAIKDLGCGVSYERNEKSAMFDFKVTDVGDKQHDVNVVMRALYVGLNDLQTGYGEYITVENK